jgi:hypothetical protein
MLEDEHTFQEETVLQAKTALDDVLKTFLREVADNSIKVDVLCYFTRLATSGYYKLDEKWKSVLPTSPVNASTLQPQGLHGLPATGCHAASFSSTQELLSLCPITNIGFGVRHRNCTFVQR